MGQLQFRSDDTIRWPYGFGTGVYGDITVSSSRYSYVTGGEFSDWGNEYATFAGTAGNAYGTANDTHGFTSAYITMPILVLIHQTHGSGAGTWELNRIVGGITSSNGQSITFSHALQNTYSTSGENVAQLITIPETRNFTVSSGQTLSVPGWDGSRFGITAIMCSETFTLPGIVNGIAAGYRGGAGRITGGIQSNGEGYAYNQSRTNVNPSGDNAGGAAGDTSGAGGGNGTAGANNNTGQSIGGYAAGNSGLTSLVLGGGGSGGTAGNGGGSGGSGGGAIFIFARDINVSGGIIHFYGGAGASGGSGRGGGGGAGGSILMKARQATLGSDAIYGPGNGGGSGSEGAGGGGGMGRVHLDYAVSYTGTTIPTIDARQDETINYVKQEENYTLLM